MNTLVHFFNKTFKRLRVLSRLDVIETFSLRRKSQLEGCASVYVYPNNEMKVSKNASIRVANGLLAFSKPWFKVDDDSQCVFEIEGNGKLECEGDFDFVRGSRCDIKDGAILHLGNDSRLGMGATILCCKEIVIGNRVWISDGVLVSDSEGKIVIEDGAWLGNGVQVGGNISIGKNAVVGEGVKVTRSVEEGMVVL